MLDFIKLYFTCILINLLILVKFCILNIMLKSVKDIVTIHNNENELYSENLLKLSMVQ